MSFGSFNAATPFAPSPLAQPMPGGIPGMGGGGSAGMLSMLMPLMQSALGGGQQQPMQQPQQLDVPDTRRDFTAPMLHMAKGLGGY